MQHTILLICRIEQQTIQLFHILTTIYESITARNNNKIRLLKSNQTSIQLLTLSITYATDPNDTRLIHH